MSFFENQQKDVFLYFFLYFIVNSVILIMAYSYNSAYAVIKNGGSGSVRRVGGVFVLFKRRMW